MMTTIMRVAISLLAVAFGIYFIANSASNAEAGIGITLIAIGGLALVPRT